MALDGLFLYSIKEDLKNLIGYKVDKINQPEKDEIIINLRGNKTNKKLLISASSNYPRIHLTNVNKQNPQKAPMFCMILRKYLNGSKIISIEQLNFDRIICLKFQGMDDLGFDSKYSLIIEIMGRHSNITLLRDRDNIIMDSIKHITSDINTYRGLYPGIQYVYPPNSNKLNPLNFTLEDFKNYIEKNKIDLSFTVFSKSLTGISTSLSKELFYKLQKENEKETYTINDLYSFFKNFINVTRENTFQFTYYVDNKGKPMDFHCVPLYNSEQIYTKKVYDSPSNLLENFYYKKDKLDRLKNKSADLQKLVHTNIERCKKKIKILTNTLKNCESKDVYKLYGELLTSNIYTLKKGLSSINVVNYYSENGDSLTIKLDPNKTPSENVQYYYKKYTKLKTSEQMGKIQLKNTEEELNYLFSVLTNIENVDNYDEIEEIKKELIETGYIKFKKSLKNKSKNKKESKPLHFISTNGCNIYVGKNNLQNDYLTLKFAHKNDIWMHTKEVHGSHVIIKNDGNITDKTLEEAAALAAYYSKGKDSSKVQVDYTEVKNVKKPTGAKPGMVIYYTNKTILIQPEKVLEPENN